MRVICAVNVSYNRMVTVIRNPGISHHLAMANLPMVLVERAQNLPANVLVPHLRKQAT
jgi:hypothetical protein